MSAFRKWEDVKKELEEDFTKEDFEEIRFEKELIEATIEARKKTNLTQQELSKKSGIKQPAIAKLETSKRTPKITTLIKLLYPMGYTLKVVPINEGLNHQKRTSPF